MTKAVTVFAGGRDQYQLAIALAEKNLLQAHVADVYFPGDRKWFQQSLGRIFSEATIQKRFRPQLPSRNVHISKQSLAATLLKAALPTININPYKDHIMGKDARRIAEKANSAIFSYSYYAYDALNNPDLPYRFLFQVHPHPKTVHNLLLEELQHVPSARDSLTYEVEYNNRTSSFRHLSRESALANGWVAASSFTRSTLVDSGVPYDNIHVIPYGVETSLFPMRPTYPPLDQPFTIIFVGQMMQRKGISYLLDAIRLLKSKNIRVILCGRGFVDKNLLNQYSDIDFELNIGLSREGLLEKLHSSHIFILPSSIEGFGHVILEAMSTGLPIVTTPHTCGPDVIEEGQHGFIVPIRSPEAIAEKITWAIENPQELAEMGVRAHERAMHFTWERFRHEIVHAYEQMLRTVDS